MNNGGAAADAEDAAARTEAPRDLPLAAPLEVEEALGAVLLSAYHCYHRYHYYHHRYYIFLLLAVLCVCVCFM